MLGTLHRYNCLINQEKDPSLADISLLMSHNCKDFKIHCLSIGEVAFFFISCKYTLLKTKQILLYLDGLFISE